MRQGFTMMELIIVVALIAIIGAIVLPDFVQTTERTKIKSDIQSTRILINAMELYDAEYEVALIRSSVSTDIGLLKSAGYVKETPVLQTPGAEWIYEGGQLKINIHGASQAVKDYYTMLSSAVSSGDNNTNDAELLIIKASS